jgi:glyoxylate reductase
MTKPPAIIAIDLPAGLLEDLRRSVTPIVTGSDPAAVAEALPRAEGILCSALLPLPAELLDRAPRLRVISNFGVGYNNVDLEAATARGIAVCNTPGVLSGAVADLTLALILAIARRLLANAAYVRAGGWSRREPPPPLGWDPAGKTLGIVGFGRIGQAVALRARAFGMEVVYHDLVTDPVEGLEDCRPVSLEELLETSDVVSLHVNLDPSTHHLIGARELALMKPTAWLINTSRGQVVDQQALTAALRDGTIAGAALDVLDPEPPAPDDPLLAMENVIVLPHVGSATVETRAAMRDMAVRNLVAVLTGRTPPSCVNPSVLERAGSR